MANIIGEIIGEGAAGLVNAVGDQINKKSELQTDLAKTEILADTEITVATLKDKDSARQREIGVKDKTPMILAYGITLGFFGILAFMMKYDIPPVNKTELDLILGSLGTAWIAVVSYYFGSSAGSSEKNNIIGNLSK